MQYIGGVIFKLCDILPVLWNSRIAPIEFDVSISPPSGKDLSPLSQSAASIQVTWSLSANQRPGLVFLLPHSSNLCSSEPAAAEWNTPLIMKLSSAHSRIIPSMSQTEEVQTSPFRVKLGYWQALDVQFWIRVLIQSYSLAYSLNVQSFVDGGTKWIWSIY